MSEHHYITVTISGPNADAAVKSAQAQAHFNDLEEPMLEGCQEIYLLLDSAHFRL